MGLENKALDVLKKEIGEWINNFLQPPEAGDDAEADDDDDGEGGGANDDDDDDEVSDDGIEDIDKGMQKKKAPAKKKSAKDKAAEKKRKVCARVFVLVCACVCMRVRVRACLCVRVSVLVSVRVRVRACVTAVHLRGSIYQAAVLASMLRGIPLSSISMYFIPSPLSFWSFVMLCLILFIAAVCWQRCARFPTPLRPKGIREESSTSQEAQEGTKRSRRRTETSPYHTSVSDNSVTHPSHRGFARRHR